MILHASGLAGVVTIAAIDAVCVLLSTDVVGQGLGVHGSIGNLAIGTDAVVCQGVLCRCQKRSVCWTAVALTTSQVLASVAALVSPGICRQIRGHWVIWD